MKSTATRSSTNQPRLLELRAVTTIFPTKRGDVRAVDNVDLVVHRGEIMGIVGESGCGKSTVLRTVMGLVPEPGKITAGEILYRDEDLLRLPKRKLRDIRGQSISMIFQDPLSTLNPVFRIGKQILEVLALHGIQGAKGWRRLTDRSGRKAQYRRVIRVMEEVGIPAPEDRYKAFPFEFSGGMQQRALIALGLVGEGSLLLADEPTTALDVTIQAQIIELMKTINNAHDTTIVIVTHDLGLAAEFCDTIAVMYAGRIVERGPADSLVRNPQHPYTQGLLACLPQATRGKLDPIPGNVPDLSDLPEGCSFAPRCPKAAGICRSGIPNWAEVKAGWNVLCNFPGDSE